MADSASLNRGLKRRLVGALALVVISLAITPLLFDAAGYKSGNWRIESHLRRNLLHHFR